MDLQNNNNPQDREYTTSSGSLQVSGNKILII